MKEYIYTEEIGETGGKWHEKVGELIRCKDCKHYKIGTEGLYYCYNHDDDILWQDDDYCSRGERKES